jgi:ketosteroid isomerase-like protein
MVSLIKATGIIAVILLCASFSSTKESVKPDYTAIEKKIKDTYAEITKAVERIDANEIFSYVLENDKGCLIQRGKIVLTRKEALESYKEDSRDIKKVTYKFDKKYVTVISPQTAVLAAEGSFEATTADGRTFGSPFAQTVVFVLKDNKWKVLHSHTSRPADGQ